MRKVARLNLKDSKAENSVLLLIFEAFNKRIRVSTGISVPTKHWNKKTMYLRENREFPDYVVINPEIDKVKENAKSAYKFYENQGILPTASQLRDKYLEFVSKPIKKASSTTFWTYFDDFIEYKRSKISKRTLIDYDDALRKHLGKVEEDEKTPLTFDALKMDGGFIGKFEEYLQTKAINSDGGKGLALNTIGKQMKNLKSFLNWCFDCKNIEVFRLKHIVTCQEDVDDVFLNLEELKLIEELELDNEELIKARDLFLFGCQVGLRFSDLRRITKNHIIQMKLNIIPIKTKEKLTFPLNSIARKIVEKYEFNLPNYEENELQLFNEKVRKVCEMAKINELILCKRTINTKVQESFQEKYKLISSHTCRRTLCTNLYLKKFPLKLIMSISGHKTTKSFYRYLKLTDNKIIENYEKELAA
jgi:integrase